VITDLQDTPVQQSKKSISWETERKVGTPPHSPRQEIVLQLAGAISHDWSRRYPWPELEIAKFLVWNAGRSYAYAYPSLLLSECRASTASFRGTETPAIWCAEVSRLPRRDALAAPAFI
jgi:hypothetical protein